MRHYKEKQSPHYMKPCVLFRWAKRSGSFRVWDTETTGLEDDSKIVSMGIVDQDGEVLLDTLINPLSPIPSDATAIHGITDEMVQSAPTFAEVYPQIRRALLGQRWLIYNKNYDIPRLEYECWRHACLFPAPAHFIQSWGRGHLSIFDDAHCAMESYAEHWGSFSEYHGSYTWQSLVNAARQQSLPQTKKHHALEDAITTLNLINKLALSEDRIQKQGA